MKGKGGRKTIRGRRRRKSQPGSEFRTLDYASMGLPELHERIRELYSRPPSNAIKIEALDAIGRTTVTNLEAMEKSSMAIVDLLDAIDSQIAFFTSVRNQEGSASVRHPIKTCIGVMNGMRGRIEQGAEAADREAINARIEQRRPGKAIDPFLPSAPSRLQQQRRFQRMEGRVYLGERQGQDIWVRLTTLEGLLGDIPERARLKALMEFDPHKHRGTEKEREKKREPLDRLARHAIYEARAAYEQEVGKRPGMLALLRYMERRGKPL